MFEPAKGEFTFEFHDQHMDMFHAAGMKPIITIRSDSSWGSREGHHAIMSSPPINMDDYTEFLQTVVDRYKGRVKYWQIENEIVDDKALVGLNIGATRFWMGSREEYVDLLKSAYEVIKNTDPDAEIVLQGFAHSLFMGIEEENESLAEFFDYIMSHGDYFDVVDFHYYYEPEMLHGIIDILRGAMERHGYDKPLICTEAGDLDIRLFDRHFRHLQGQDVPAVPIVEELMELPDVGAKIEELSAGGITEQDRIDFGVFLSTNPEARPVVERFQAENLVKRVVLSFSLGVESFNWHIMMDQKEDPMNWWFTLMGLMDAEGTHKPSYYTYKLLIEKLYGIAGVEKVGNHSYRFRFKEDKPPVYVAWKNDGDIVLDLSHEITGEVEVTHIITERGITHEDVVTERMDSSSITVGNTPIIFAAANAI